MQKLIDHQEFGGMRVAFHLEGAATEGTGILESPSIETAKAWYNSPFFDDVKGALKQALIPTLQEAGCEGMFETSREGDPHKLVYFEIFSSSAAHKFHLEQDYMKRLFTALEGKLAGATIMTKLKTL